VQRNRSVGCRWIMDTVIVTLFYLPCLNSNMTRSGISPVEKALSLVLSVGSAISPPHLAVRPQRLVHGVYKPSSPNSTQLTTHPARAKCPFPHRYTQPWEWKWKQTSHPRPHRTSRASQPPHKPSPSPLLLRPPQQPHQHQPQKRQQKYQKQTGSLTPQPSRKSRTSNPSPWVTHGSSTARREAGFTTSCSLLLPRLHPPHSRAQHQHLAPPRPPPPPTSSRTPTPTPTWKKARWRWRVRRKGKGKKPHSQPSSPPPTTAQHKSSAATPRRPRWMPCASL
jgi:hypothetical protein